MAKKVETSNKTTLTLLERVIIPGILKKESDYKTQVINRDLTKKIEITQDEFKKFEFKVLETGGMGWNQKGVKAKFQYEFTELETLELKLALTKLDEDKKLTNEFISLYEKFVK